MPPFGFPQDGCEVPAAERKTLFDAASHGHFGPSTRNSVLSRENPHGSGPVIHEECAASQGAIGIDDSSRDCDIFSSVAARVAVDFGNALPGRTGNEQQNSYGK